MPGPFSSVHTISWTANTETDLAGYRVYIGTVTNGSDILIADVGNVTSYPFTITVSQTYYLSVTAYDTSNNESLKSTEVTRSWLLLGNF